MARSIGDAIPPPIRPLFSGDDLESREGLTFLVLTTTQEGWPHVAMIGVGEIVAVGPRDLRLALWPNSTATANLTQSGRVTLALVHDGVGYSLRCSAERGPDLPARRTGPLAFFRLHVVEVFEDVAPYATLNGGIMYRLNDPTTVVPGWRETIADLRAR
jgi:hypothetical protein